MMIRKLIRLIHKAFEPDRRKSTAVKIIPLNITLCEYPGAWNAEIVFGLITVGQITG